MRRKIIAAPRNAAEAVAVGVSLVLVCGAAVTIVGDAGVQLGPIATVAAAQDRDEDPDEVPDDNPRRSSDASATSASTLPDGQPSAPNMLEAVSTPRSSSTNRPDDPTSSSSTLAEMPYSLSTQPTRDSGTIAALPGAAPSTTGRPAPVSTSPSSPSATSAPSSPSTSQPPVTSTPPPVTSTPPPVTETEPPPTETEPPPTETPIPTPTPDPTTTPEDTPNSGGAGNQIAPAPAPSPGEDTPSGFSSSLVGPAAPQDASTA